MFCIAAGLGGKRISVSRVHALLTRELAALHATAPQRNLVATEIQKVTDIPRLHLGDKGILLWIYQDVAQYQIFVTTM